MEFAHPFIFGFSVFLTLSGGIFFWWRRKTQKILALKIPVFHELLEAEKSALGVSWNKLIFWGQWFFFLSTVVFLTIALARPQSVTESKKITKNGVDILIALDVSESMLAEDLEPNRMDAAKKYIDEFVSKLDGDRVGLEVFAGKPFTQSPLSFDYNVIRYYLGEISTETIDQQRRGLSGTAIGDAIVSAVNRFQNSQDRTKVLVLLTDGDANVGTEPIFAAEHARTNGIKIYTIGLGKKEGAPLPIGVQNGQTLYARNQDGSLYKTAFDEETLQNIAKVSGGKYFYAGDNNSLEKSLETINGLEKKEYETETSITREDHFWIWLVGGFLSSLMAIFLRFLSFLKNDF